MSDKKNILNGNSLKGIGLKIQNLSEKNRISVTRAIREANMNYGAYDRLVETERCNVTTIEKLSNYFKVPITYWYNPAALQAYTNIFNQAIAGEPVPIYGDLEHQIEKFKEQIQYMRNELKHKDEIISSKEETILLLKEKIRSGK